MREHLPPPALEAAIDEPTTQATVDPAPIETTDADTARFVSLRNRAKELGGHCFRTRDGSKWRYHVARSGVVKTFETTEAVVAWLVKLQLADKVVKHDV